MLSTPLKSALVYLCEELAKQPGCTIQSIQSSCEITYPQKLSHGVLQHKALADIFAGMPTYPIPNVLYYGPPLLICYSVTHVTATQAIVWHYELMERKQ